jgi:hypothetical protein
MILLLKKLVWLVRFLHPQRVRGKANKMKTAMALMRMAGKSRRENGGQPVRPQPDPVQCRVTLFRPAAAGV